MTATGTYSVNNVSFVDTDLAGSSCQADGGPGASPTWTTTITRLDPVGGIIEGTYLGGPVSPVVNVNDLMGHFTVCHAPDEAHL